MNLTPAQTEELLETVKKIAHALNSIATTLNHANLGVNLNQIARNR